MNGGHDLGGMHGFGPINAESEALEPVFHADWEKRVFGLSRAASALGQWNGDMSRHARERQHPVDYLRHSYYENWLAGLERLLMEAGLVTARGLLADHALGNRSVEHGDCRAIGDFRLRLVSRFAYGTQSGPHPAA